MNIQPRFGLLTASQKQRLQEAKTGPASASEKLIAELAGTDAQEAQDAPKLTAEQSTALAAQIQKDGTVEWKMRSPVPENLKAQASDRLERIQDALDKAPFAASDEVVDALAGGFSKNRPSAERSDGRRTR